MTFWSEKSWRKTLILLVRYVSLTWQSIAWRADQMLSFLNLLHFGASCCCLLLLAMCCLQILLSHLNMFFPNVPHAITKKCQKNHQYGFIHAFKHLMLSICSYIESSWMNYLQCEFFLVSPNDDVSRQRFHSRQLATVFTLLVLANSYFSRTNCDVCSLRW